MFLHSKPKTYHLSPITYHPKSNQGFTLVELIVVIALISIILGLSITSYINYRQKSKLQIATQEVRSALVEASDYAFAPQHQDVITGDIAKGYGVELDKYSNTYYVFWSTNTAHPYDTRHNIKTYQLPNNIQITDPEGQTLVFFQVPPEIPGGKKIYFKGLNTGTGTITLKLTGTTQTKQVTVNCNTGVIDIK